MIRIPANNQAALIGSDIDWFHLQCDLEAAGLVLYQYRRAVDSLMEDSLHQLLDLGLYFSTFFISGSNILHLLNSLTKEPSQNRVAHTRCGFIKKKKNIVLRKGIKFSRYGSPRMQSWTSRNLEAKVLWLCISSNTRREVACKLQSRRWGYRDCQKYIVD